MAICIVNSLFFLNIYFLFDNIKISKIAFIIFYN